MTLTTKTLAIACSSRLKSTLSVLLQVVSCRNSRLGQNSHLEGLTTLILCVSKGIPVNQGTRRKIRLVLAWLILKRWGGAQSLAVQSTSVCWHQHLGSSCYSLVPLDQSRRQSQHHLLPALAVLSPSLELLLPAMPLGSFPCCSQLR